MVNLIPKSENWERVRKLQKKLQELDLDAYLIHANGATYENMRYLANHWPLFESGGILVPKEGIPYLLIGAEAPKFAEESAFGAESVRIVYEYGHAATFKWVGAHYCSIKEIVDEISHGKGIKRLGLGDYTITPAPIYNAFKEALLPGGEMIPADNIMQELRMHKSENEVNCIREASRITEIAFNDMLKVIKPEMSEYECSGIYAAGLYRNGGEGPSFPMLYYAGERTVNMIGRETHNPIGYGRLCNIDGGALYGGYSCAYGRPLVFGKMDSEMRKHVDFCLDTHKRVMYEYAKLGRKGKEVYQLFREQFEKNGYGTPPASAFHGVGIFEYEPPRGGIDVEQEICEDMVLCCDTFVRTPNYGLRFEDVFRVTPDGPEIFTKSNWGYIEL